MTHKVNSRRNLGDLHELLLKACPAAQKGGSSIRRTLAPALGVTHQYVYRWIEEKRIPAKFVLKIAEVSEGRVTIEDLIPFVI